MLKDAPTKELTPAIQTDRGNQAARMEAPRPWRIQHTSDRLQSQCPARNFLGLLPQNHSDRKPFHKSAWRFVPTARMWGMVRQPSWAQSLFATKVLKARDQHSP
jgi:hypothetical protein